MWNGRPDESQVGITIAGKNINNLRYADDTTLMAESEEELKELLDEVERREWKSWLKIQHSKTKIMASGPIITSWQICVCWVMSDSVTPWTVALQASLYMGFPRKDCWTAVSYSRGSFWPKDWTHVSYVLCIDRRILYQLGYLGSQIEGGKVKYFILGGSKISADGDCRHEIKRQLFLGRKAMINLDGIWKSRDITLSTKVCLVKAMVFPVVMYRHVRVGP